MQKREDRWIMQVGLVVQAVPAAIQVHPQVVILIIFCMFHLQLHHNCRMFNIIDLLASCSLHVSDIFCSIFSDSDSDSSSGSGSEGGH